MLWRGNFRVVSTEPFQFNNGIPLIENRLWSSDYNQVRDFDIGIMPLIGNDYDKAKGGYKLLEYMANSIPYVCTQTADNFLEDGVTGYIAESEDEWVQKLSILVKDEKKRNEMGNNGRNLVENRFDLTVKGPELYSIMNRFISIKG